MKSGGSFQFTEELRNALQATGWSPKRVVDIRKWIDPLNRLGIKMSEESTQILGTLGGISVSGKRSATNKLKASMVRFDPSGVEDYVDSIQFWEAQLSERLSPFAYWSNDVLLTVAESHRVLGLWPPKLYDIGSSFGEALNALVFPVNPIQEFATDLSAEHDRDEILRTFRPGEPPKSGDK